MSIIFDNIERLCREQLISIRQLEEAAGIGHATINRWRTSSPTVAKLESVAEVLGVDISELLRGNADNREGR